MRSRLFARNPAAWLLALFNLCRAPRPARADEVCATEVDEVFATEGGALSGVAEISGLP